MSGCAPSPSVATMRRAIDSDANGVCRVCEAEPDWKCDEVAHRQAKENMSNPKQAYGDRKPPLHLVPPALAIGASIALGEGAPKYGPYNWRDTPVENLTYIGALLRHAYAYLDGEDVDPESVKGKTHLQGIAGCIAILLDSEAMGILIDKRPAKGPAPELLRDPTYRASLAPEVTLTPDATPGDPRVWRLDDAALEARAWLDDITSGKIKAAP